ncbi:2-keto-4-pentenoate hydratase [Euzebya tangerina]|uniref:2-keto-4-pentenoate hydratase n=1 Tax=Euzebya tangerina TaxID=591198 RepID=UPI00196A8649|nr:2-oxopent-4-enoate hydratase [Euzebya tangerina]
MAGGGVAEAAEELHRARVARRTVAPLSERWPDMTPADAYAVQAAGIQARLAEGETVIGGKLGFTSAAMRRAMGVDSPNYGWLTDAMLLGGPEVDVADHVSSRMIHPKVEPEIAVRLAADLEAPVTAAEVLAATESVMACLELVDSRFTGFRFGPLDNIADNSSAGAVVLGQPVPLGDINLRLIGVVVEVDGAVHHTAAGAAAHDDPAAAVAWMVNHCARPLAAGSLVISGGLTAPVTLVEPLPGGHDRGLTDGYAENPPIVHNHVPTVTAHFDRLGSVTVHAAVPHPTA